MAEKPNEENANDVEKTVTIANGAGNRPIVVDHHPGDMVASVLDRANLTLEAGTTVSIGRKRVEDIDKTTVAAGDVLVIAGKVSNG